MNKKTLILILSGSLILPSLTHATTLLTIVDNAKDSLVLLGSGLATIAFIVAGIMYLMGAGNPTRMATAKTSLIAAVIGIVIILLATGAQAFVSAFFGLNK